MWNELSVCGNLFFSLKPVFLKNGQYYEVRNCTISFAVLSHINVCICILALRTCSTSKTYFFQDTLDTITC